MWFYQCYDIFIAMEMFNVKLMVILHEKEKFVIFIMVQKSDFHAVIFNILKKYKQSKLSCM